MRGHNKKMAICKPEREASPEPGHGGTLVSASRATGNIFLLFRSPGLWQSSPSWLRQWIKPEHLLCQGKCRLNVASLLLFLLPTIAGCAIHISRILLVVIKLHSPYSSRQPPKHQHQGVKPSKSSLLPPGGRAGMLAIILSSASFQPGSETPASLSWSTHLYPLWQFSWNLKMRMPQHSPQGLSSPKLNYWVSSLQKPHLHFIQDCWRVWGGKWWEWQDQQIILGRHKGNVCQPSFPGELICSLQFWAFRKLRKQRKFHR